MKTLVLALDLAGTFVFALSGAMTAVRHRLDLFGILVLSLAAATFGGIGRDLLIGAVPPAAIADWRYFAVPILAGLTVFFVYSATARLHTAVLILDGAGLALFAVSGALKALAFGLTPIAAIMLGVLTGVGGGIARDILVAEIPTVLRAELYAVAALAGASVVVVGRLLNLPSLPLALAGGGLCFGLRFMAIRHGWHLPKACQSDQLTFDSVPPPQ
ncbi:MAG TPA: trimeric intracellular cation channel family protein, partial [Chthoniobacterales bacterium]|nr:trimeric intracellular cation channel family protein [Chthoniobacterales bacterium]